MTAYGETAGAQAAADKARADAFATVLSVMSCSVGIAVLAQVSMRRLALRAGLQALGRENTRLVIHYVNQGQANAVVSHVFGKAWDSLKSSGSTKFNDIAADLVRRTESALVQTLPLNRFIQLERAVTDQALTRGKMYEAVQQDNGRTNRQTLSHQLRSGGFMRPPGTELAQDLLAKKIEMAFYMMKVLSGDHIVTHTRSAHESRRSTAVPSRGCRQTRNIPRTNRRTRLASGARWKSIASA